MDKLTLVRPKQANLQDRYILVGEIENGRALLINLDFGTVNTHFRIDEIEPVAETVRASL